MITHNEKKKLLSGPLSPTVEDTCKRNHRVAQLNESSKSQIIDETKKAQKKTNRLTKIQSIPENKELQQGNASHILVLILAPPLLTPIRCSFQPPSIFEHITLYNVDISRIS